MAKAKKLPSGNWRVLLYVGVDENGKRQYESITAPTESEANLLAARRKYELERGISHDRTPEEMTVEEAIEKYIADRDEIMSPKTVRESRGYLRNHLKTIKKIKIKKLTESQIQSEINREARTLAPKTIANIYGLFYAAIRAAVPEIHYNIKLPQRQKKEMHIPTNSELQILLKAVEGKPLEIPVLLAATCGMRRGEICALDLNKDIDYNKFKIKITKAVSQNENNEWVTKQPKTTSSTREIDCPEWVIDKLKAARDSGYKIKNPARISNTFATLCDRLHLDIRFHDLRHYYASLMLSLGVPDKYAMQRMGHATPNMLKNVYQHLMDDKNEEVTEQINRYFETVQHEMQHENAGEEEKERK